MDTIVDPNDVMAMVQDIFDRLKTLSDQPVLDALQSDTVFVLGECLGTIAKAKALVRRDIDLNWKEEPKE